MVDPQDQLKQELDAHFRYLQRVRQEIAAIDRPADQDHRFESMGDQMDAIVEATETATNTIMEAMENFSSEPVGKHQFILPLPIR